MYWCRLLAGVLWVCTALQAQIPKLQVVEDSPEAFIVQQLSQASPSQRITLGEAFLQKNPDSPAVEYVLDQLESVFVESQLHDKTLKTAQRLLERVPGNPISAMHGLKAAEAKNDPDLIVEWCERAIRCGRLVQSIERPIHFETPEELADRKAYAGQLLQQAEYALFVQSQQAAAPNVKAAALTALRKDFPNSQYLNQTPALVSTKSGSRDEQVAVAEQLIRKGELSTDTLLLATSYYFQSKSDKSLTYGQKLIEYATSGEPCETDKADWTHKRRFALTNAYFMVGMFFSEREAYNSADKYLRLALPLVREDQNRHAMVLFHLGFANYRLAESTKDKARLQDAIRFTEQCASLKGPFQSAALKNLDAFRAQ